MASDRDTDDAADTASPGVFDTLLMPLRLPGRVVSDIQTLAEAVVALQRTADTHLAAVDENAGQLVEGLKDLQGSVDEVKGTVDTLEQERMPAFLEATGKLQESIDRIEGRVETLATLATLENTIEEMMAGLREDLNTRMLAVEHEVRSMQAPMKTMANDVAKIDGLLPNPDDGPLTRLKDTLTGN